MIWAVLFLAQTKFYFINTPESVTMKSTLCVINFDTNARFLFHLKNITGQKQHLFAYTTETLQGFYAININKYPGLAGTQTTYDILNKTHSVQERFYTDPLRKPHPLVGEVFLM